MSCCGTLLCIGLCVLRCSLLRSGVSWCVVLCVCEVLQTIQAAGDLSMHPFVIAQPEATHLTASIPGCKGRQGQPRMRLLRFGRSTILFFFALRSAWCTPPRCAQVSERILCSKDRVLILGSDGVWDRINSQEAGMDRLADQSTRWRNVERSIVAYEFITKCYCSAWTRALRLLVLVVLDLECHNCSFCRPCKLCLLLNESITLSQCQYVMFMDVEIDVPSQLCGQWIMQ